VVRGWYEGVNANGVAHAGAGRGRQKFRWVIALAVDGAWGILYPREPRSSIPRALNTCPPPHLHRHGRDEVEGAPTPASRTRT
jgi:hypothetical protein